MASVRPGTRGAGASGEEADAHLLSMVTIASLYPTASRPKGAFVHVLMRDLKSLGARPIVIAPEKAVVPLMRAGAEAPRLDSVDGVPVHRPRFLSFSNRRLPLGLSTYRWTVHSFRGTVLRAARRLERPDLCYAHFLFPAGYAALELGRRWRVPAVLAVGESSFDHYEHHFGLTRVAHAFRGFQAIVAASKAIREKLVCRYGVPAERVRVFPNAVADYFRPIPRPEARRRLGLPHEAIIVAFVGHFDQRKGPHRLQEALERVPQVRGVYIGAGSVRPEGPQVLFAGQVPHQEVPVWLSAADIFALPTLAEGSPNAIREAMACGLPIVSSDRPFNREFLDEAVALLVDPTDVEALAAAIRRLAEDEHLRRSMGRAALERARAFRSLDRAKAILGWMREVIARPSTSGVDPEHRER